jgi:hypothetical protein
MKGLEDMLLSIWNELGGKERYRSLWHDSQFFRIGLRLLGIEYFCSKI